MTHTNMREKVLSYIMQLMNVLCNLAAPNNCQQKKQLSLCSVLEAGSHSNFCLAYLTD